MQVKKSDLLIEFRENQVERLLIPHDIAFGERNPLPNACSGRSDMDLGMFIPLNDSHGENAIERPAILRLRKAPSTLSDTIWYWLSENARKADAKLAFQRKVGVRHFSSPTYLHGSFRSRKVLNESFFSTVSQMTTSFRNCGAYVGSYFT